MDKSNLILHIVHYIFFKVELCTIFQALDNKDARIHEYNNEIYYFTVKCVKKRNKNETRC